MVDVVGVQEPLRLAPHLRVEPLEFLTVVLDLQIAFILLKRALHAGECLELVAFDVHLDDQRLAGDAVGIVEADLADPKFHLLRGLLRHSDGRFAAIAFPALVQRDFRGIVAEREWHGLDPAGERIGVQVGDQAGIVARVGLERDDLLGQILDREHDAVEAGVGADVEKIIHPALVAQCRQLFELLGLPHSEQRNAAVDVVGGIDHEARALCAHHVRRQSEPPPRVGIELAHSVLERAERAEMGR